MSEVQCSIQLAAKKSGVTAHLIRIWERRYDAVSPNRSDTNRRLYSMEEIARLQLLRAAIDAGHRIGTIAKLPDDRLRGLVSPAAVPQPPAPPNHDACAGQLASALAAVQAFDEKSLDGVLDRAALVHGGHGLLANLVVPLATTIGELWRDGHMTAAHEHFATAILRTFLLRKFRPFTGHAHAPRLVAVTPAGQMHELGAVIVAAAANDLGWNAVYLGAHLPAAEIAGAAIQHKARAVALSLVYPPDDPELPAELLALRHHLPAGTTILAGGRAAPAYATALEAAGAVPIADLGGLYQQLDSLRTRAGRPPLPR